MPRLNAVSFHEDPDVESICRRVVAAGFDGLEVSRPPFYDRLTTPGARRRFRERARESGLELYGFDCWVDVEPYDRFAETLAGFEAAVAWAADLDLGLIISHDPWGRVNGPRGPSECLRASVELFRRVADLCAARDLALVFEPHPDTLTMEDDWAVDFVDAVGEGRPAGHVGLLYDCCHYGVGQPQTYLGAIEKLGRRIRHLHFSDGDRTTYALHLPLGDGDLDLVGAVEALRRTGFDGTLTSDLFNCPHLDDAARRNAGRIRDVEQRLGLGDAPSSVSRSGRR